MNRSRVTGDLASHGNIFVDIANDRVGIGSTIPGQKLSLPDSAKIALGNSADLTIYHDGTNSYVNNTTGTLFYLANTHYFTNPAVSEIQATFVKDGAVKLYHNGSQKFETLSTGAKITGTATATGSLIVGSGNDFQVTKSGGNTEVQNYGGTLLFGNASSNLNNVFIRGRADENSIICIPDGAVELYHDNTKRLETTSNGVNVTGRLLATGSSGRGLIFNDNVKISLGSNNDLEIYHDGSHSYIDDVGTGNLKVRSNNFRVSNADESKISATFIPSGAVELYHNNALAFSTQTDGISAFGREGNNANIYLFADEADDLADQWRIRALAASSTFEIQNRNTNALYDTNLVCKGDGAVELYHNNSKKFETTSSGATVAADSDIRFTNSSSWTGDVHGKIQLFNNVLYISGGTGGIIFREAGVTRWRINGDGHLIPEQGDGTLDIGSNSVRVRNGYFDTLYGNGANITNVNADTVDGIQGGSFLRGDVDDTTVAHLTFNRSTDAKFSLSGSNNPFFLFNEGSTSKAYIQWNANGWLQLSNTEDQSGIRIKDDIVFTQDNFSSSHKIWHEANDGSGSGLDADTLDGVQGSSFLRSDATDTCTGQITFTGQIISKQDGDKSTQGGNALILQHNSTPALRANHFIHDDFPSGSGTYYIQVTESSVTNDRNMCLQGYGGKVKIGGSGTAPDHTLHVQGTFRATDTATFNNDATFSGGAGAITVAAASDIRLGDGAWTGEHGGKIQYHNDFLYFQTGDTDTSAGWIFRDSAGASTLHLNADGSTSGKNLTFGQDVGFSGGGGAVNINANSDIRFANGNWTGDTCKIQHHGNALYIVGGSSGIRLREGSTDRVHIDGSGNLTPATDSAYSLGSSSLRWTHTYTDALTVTGSIDCGTDISVNGGAGAVSVGGGSDIRFTSGNWTGNSGSTAKIQAHANYLYIVGGSNGIIFREDGTDRSRIDGDGHFRPAVDSTYDLGLTGTRWRNIYADTLYGNGANITGLNASNISSGTIAAARFGSTSARESGVSAAGNFGQYEPHGTYTNANTEPNFWGWNFSTGTTNFPNSTSSQWYRCRVSLGSDYGKGSDGGDYSMELCYPRNSRESAGQMWTRVIENGGEGSWLEVGSRPYNSVIPRANNTIDLGSSSTRWRNIYTNDLNLSNEGGANDVDGTWGNFTIQEGEDDLFLINKRNGKKYKFNLTEV